MGALQRKAGCFPKELTDAPAVKALAATRPTCGDIAERAASAANVDICLFPYEKTIQLRELEFFQPGRRNPTFDTAGISRNLVRLHITMAKRAVDVASRNWTGRRQCMFRLTACVRVRADRLAAKDCRAVIIEQRFLTPGHQEDSPLVAVLILTNEFVGEFMRSFIAFAAFCAVLSTNPAIAEEAPTKDAVRIEMHQAAKAFVFMIDNKPVAILDETGLHVAEHLSHGGVLTDKGQKSARRDIEARAREAADE